MSRNIFRVLFTLSLSSGYVSAAGLDLPQDPTTLACTDQQRARWTEARTVSLGVEASDPIHQEIGNIAAVKSSAIIPTWAEYVLGALFLGGSTFPTLGRQWNWVPITSSKQTMCGMVDKYEFFPNQKADKEEA